MTFLFRVRNIFRTLVTPWFTTATFSVRYDIDRELFIVFCDQDGETIDTFPTWDAAWGLCKSLNGEPL